VAKAIIGAETGQTALVRAVVIGIAKRATGQIRVEIMGTRAIGTAGVEGAIVVVVTGDRCQLTHAVRNATTGAHAQAAFRVKGRARRIVRLLNLARSIGETDIAHAIREGRAGRGVDRGTALTIGLTQAETATKRRAKRVVGRGLEACAVRTAQAQTAKARTRAIAVDQTLRAER